MTNITKKVIPFFKKEGVIDLNIPVSKLQMTKVTVLKECEDCYSVKGIFKESNSIVDRISAINSAVDYIGNINPNYQSIIFRTKDKEEKELAKAAGFTYDDDATMCCHSEGVDDLTVYSIKNMEYKKTIGQKGLSI